MGDLQPSAVKFTHTAFWIRVTNLPIKSMTREVGEDIGKEVGKLLDVDVPNENGIAWGRFLQIRVEVEIAKPLMRGCIIQVEDDKPAWVDFRYEHLPIFCYNCGLLGHSSSDCTASRGREKASVFYRDQYGSWLRASPARYHQATRHQAEFRNDIGNCSNSNHRGEEGSGSGGGGESEPQREVRNEVTSTENQALQTEHEREGIPDLVELVDTEKEVLHIPVFLDAKLGDSSVGIVGFNEEQNAGQKPRTDTSTSTMPCDLVQKFSENDMGDNVQDMDADQCDDQVVHGDARELELDDSKQIGVEVENSDRAGFIGPAYSKAQVKKSTWKKRARVSQSIGGVGPSANPVALSRKRAARAEAESEGDEENRLKKARNSGGVFIHESVSVAAVDQPRRSQ